MDLRWVILLLSHYLLLFLCAELNHHLAPWHLHFLPAGLFIAYAAMRFSPRAAFLATLGAGLLLDASHPAPWGAQTFSLLLLLGAIHSVRSRIGTGDYWQLVLVAVAATPAHHLVLAVASVPALPGLGTYAARCTIDAVLSTALAALAGPWWFSLQNTLLGMLGFDRRDELAETA
jgi:rod shape-determining protein MreD